MTHNTKTILVAGGAGFIGSHLCDVLVGQGSRVLCVDNLLTSTKKNIEHLVGKENFVFIQHDIIEPLFVEEKIDQIYNLACPASPVHYQNNPIRTIKASTVGMINLLGLARTHGARILQASTSEVYGDPTEHPQTEEYCGNVNTIGPRACYDEGKRCAETLCFDYNRVHDIEIKVVRIFNTYGPRMAANDGRVVSNFIVAALQNKPLEIDGDGSQTRSFCYVDDLVLGIIAMMQTPKEVMGPINLGNQTENTIVDFAQKIIGLTASSSVIQHSKHFREDDPMQRCPDITKARQFLKWEPRVSLDDGLEKTIAYFKKTLV